MSSFFVEPGDRGTIKPGTILRALTDPDNLVRANPGYATMFDDLAELRKQNDRPEGGGEFRRVASLSVPAFLAHDIANSINWLREPKAFYAWADSPQGKPYMTYDRRKAANRGDMLTMVDGKVVT
jgi:hypothetical protein